MDRLPNQRRTKPTVGDMEHYLGRVRGVLISLADRLTPQEAAEVEDFISHGEPAEGLRTLAWILVEEHKTAPARTIADLRSLTAGLILDEDMPQHLDDCAEL